MRARLPTAGAKKLATRPAVMRLIASMAKQSPILRHALGRYLYLLKPPKGVILVGLPNGSSIRLDHDGDEDITTELYWHGFSAYENGTPAWFLQACRGARAVIDVGANIGYYTLLAAAVSERARVLSVEPVPQFYRKLVENVRLNGWESRVLAIEAAATERPGVCKLFVPNNGVLCESSVLEGFRPGASVMSVRATTVDSLVREYGLKQLDLVKVDVEGAEHLVFEGAKDTLVRFRPDIMCEVLPGRFRRETEALLRAFGYGFAWIRGGESSWAWRGSCPMSHTNGQTTFFQCGSNVASRK